MKEMCLGTDHRHGLSPATHQASGAAEHAALSPNQIIYDRATSGSTAALKTCHGIAGQRRLQSAGAGLQVLTEVHG